MGEPVGTLTALSDTNQLVADPALDVRGRSVIDSSGEKIGTVADLLVDTTTNHVRFLRVEHGGVLGFGAQSTFIPVESIARVTEDEVYVSSSKDHVAGGPGTTRTWSTSVTTTTRSTVTTGTSRWWRAGRRIRD
ncbi:PRC-barrel domain-containing protein [Actinoplanes sp. CA-252034]|uniref:PRC-barrel domain-containing protein n=1 Tax=Actinoplanes sp. CA-252034 TaxID=3239906 RepID=UPI003D95D521